MAASSQRVALDLPPNQLRTFLTIARRLSFTRAAEELLVPYGVTPDVVAESNSLLAIARLVETGIGVSLISRLAVADELARGRLCEVSLRGIDAHRPIFLLIHRDKHRTRAIRAFQALLPPLLIPVDGTMRHA